MSTSIDFEAIVRQIQARTRKTENTSEAPVVSKLAANKAAAKSVKAAKVSAITATAFNSNACLPSVDLCKLFIVSLNKARSQADYIDCLRCFTGFQASEPVGTQVDSARFLARRIIDNKVEKTDVAYSRAGQARANGWVPGLPDNTAKEISGLRAQCRSLVEDMGKAEQSRASTKAIESSLRTVRARLETLGVSEFDDCDE